MKVLLVNPPMSEAYGPYPAVTFLAGFLRTIGHEPVLADASLDVLERIFSRAGLAAVREVLQESLGSGCATAPATVERYLQRAAHYEAAITTAMACLRTLDAGAFARAARPGFFPPPLEAADAWASASHFNLASHEAAVGPLSTAQRQRLLRGADQLRFAFGREGSTDRARFLAEAMLDDIARAIRAGVDPEFRLSEYMDRLVDGAPTFAPYATRLAAPPKLIYRLIDACAADLRRQYAPDVVGLSVPFPGCVYGALRLAAAMRRERPAIRIVMGGGWVNTELRDLSDPAIFDYVDAITYDDGERPLQCWLEHVAGTRDEDQLKRTRIRRAGAVVWIDGAPESDVPQAEAGTPTHVNLPLDRYLVAADRGFRLWGRRWNKVLLAHGCYWKKCTFCDVHLDYIGRYEPVALDAIVARIRALLAETGNSGFHFVDEAMPPALLARLAQRLIDERLEIAWWGNVRFDAALAPMADVLARSGCVGLTGGLEVASDRVLALIAKGISLEGVARVCAALSGAGVLVHAYLIFGFPTQTTAETVDALEYVRQMFAAGYLQSAIWHRFALTKYSPIARDPARFGLTLPPTPLDPFVNYLLPYVEADAAPHDTFASPLTRAARHYRQGVSLDRPVQDWFADDAIIVPKPSLPADFVTRLVRCG